MGLIFTGYESAFERETGSFLTAAMGAFVVILALAVLWGALIEVDFFAVVFASVFIPFIDAFTGLFVVTFNTGFTAVLWEGVFDTAALGSAVFTVVFAGLTGWILCLGPFGVFKEGEGFLAAVAFAWAFVATTAFFKTGAIFLDLEARGFLDFEGVPFFVGTTFVSEPAFDFTELFVAFDAGCILALEAAFFAFISHRLFGLKGLFLSD